MVKEDGALSATAYLLSQDSLVQGLEEEFTFGAYKSFQVPIRRVEELTGLGFSDLKDAEPAGTLEALGRESFGVREIAAPEDITL